MMKSKIFVSCPVYLEDLLEKEILRTGGTILKRGAGGHLAECSLSDLYRLMLMSRIASRILLHLADFSCQDGESIYEVSRQFPWERVMERTNTVSCSCTIAGKSPLQPKLGSLKTKDGLVDYWRDNTGERPDVSRENPDISVHVHLHGEESALYLDLSGEGLHKRGYRLDAAKAGLKENTAAAILYRAGWPRIASAGGTLVDPMCGSGTLLIEGAFMAAGIPAGLHRSGYGFFHWKDHDPDLWEAVFDEAESLWTKKKGEIPQLVGYEHDKKALSAARENIRRAGLEEYIHLEKRELGEFSVTERMKKAPGLIVTNPPYGQRLGEKGALYSLYRTLGDLGKNSDLKDWNMSVISDDEGLLRSIGLKADRKNKVMNGPIHCSLFHYHLFGTSGETESFPHKAEPIAREISVEELSLEAEQFLNRLKKNLKQRRKWMRNSGVSCYRLYDADLPNFNFAVDCYEGKWIHMQEYAAPSGIDPKKAAERLKQAVEIVASLMNIPESSVFLKQRKRQKGKSQYSSMQRQGERYLIREWDCRFWANFTDYLDTGIFLDHRNVRKYIKDHSQGKTVLNLYCYTGTASVMAAAGGAEKVYSVDASSTYLKWAQDNFLLNKIKPENHFFIKSDVQEWMDSCREKFDLIFMDPPTFSNSKSRRDAMQIQEDHKNLILQAMKCVRKDGLLIFSNNYKKFSMDESLFDLFHIEEASNWTQSPDFSRKGASHRCWLISYDE
jgi:23S rRNA (guanine2445-N2)-methyltransferase / 23S rRNA (guanine2069-N7)-methyltransferase